METINHVIKCNAHINPATIYLHTIPKFFTEFAADNKQKIAKEEGTRHTENQIERHMYVRKKLTN